MTMNNKITRRNLLRAGAAGSSALLIGSGAMARTYSANEKIRFACIGIGGMGGKGVRVASREQIVAVTAVEIHQRVVPTEPARIVVGGTTGMCVHREGERRAIVVPAGYQDIRARKCQPQVRQAPVELQAGICKVHSDIGPAYDVTDAYRTVMAAHAHPGTPVGLVRLGRQHINPTNVVIIWRCISIPCRPGCVRGG